MLILFEGNEGSGKTTLIQRLRVAMPQALHCARKSFKNFNAETSEYDFNWDLTTSALYDWRFFLEMHADNFKTHDFICDRSFITQDVYQKATGPWSITPNHTSIMQSYHKVVEKIPHIVFLCRRDVIKENDSHIHAHGKYELIDAEYDNWAIHSKLNWHRIDNSKRTIEESLELCLAHIENAKTKFIY